MMVEYAEGGHVAPYTNGGLLVGGCVPARIHPDECFVSSEDAHTGRWRCCRKGHPTATSGCAKHDDQPA